MKKGDFVWGAILAAICALLLTPGTEKVFIAMTMAHPYIMAFIKFAILATMGDLLAIRIVTGDWSFPSGLVARAGIWGFLGVVIALIFTIFPGGVIAAQGKGMLPFNGNAFAFAFFTSTITNIVFAPTMMAFHRYTDTMIDLKSETGSNPSIKEITERIDWYGFVSFVILKTIPFFWIPAHTITFLLPPEFRVLAAAFLSIALGAILAFAKKKQTQSV